MRYIASRYRVDQLQLFQPPRQYPHWANLPQEIQHKTLRLLARLLREHAHKMKGDEPAKERDDE